MLYIILPAEDEVGRVVRRSDTAAWEIRCSVLRTIVTT